MKLKIIPTKSSLQTSQPLMLLEVPTAQLTQNNSTISLHVLHEISPLIPNSDHFQHAMPPWAPSSYSLWPPTITKSQNLQHHHAFRIPAFLFEVLMRCYSSWVNSGQVAQDLVKDMTDTWISLKSSKNIKRCFDGKREWFVRLDQMSPKDSALIPGPTRSIKDVVRKLASGMKAYGVLHREADEAKVQKKEMVMHVMVNAWNASMSRGFKFRALVAPAAAQGVVLGLDAGKYDPEDFCLVAISKYRWLKPFTLPDGLTTQQVADMVQDGAHRVLLDITRSADNSLGREVHEMLIKSKFTVNVSLQ
ncbi:hypothetical protein K469DRAFT_803968 [Zopfia rhizophila CBS 207.26]|uniref:Uncharacterized protein n=1 Tax=Zopfia rhizophila CBS 207.26 TaxID=1314779 RepID=A0A6A6DF34_9PEZI|nr:hypothetical protein K469DRAFT_803968 [Zopfia rhizophila CBS 207.26]